MKILRTEGAARIEQAGTVRLVGLTPDKPLTMTLGAPAECFCGKLVEIGTTEDGDACLVHPEPLCPNLGCKTIAEQTAPRGPVLPAELYDGVEVACSGCDGRVRFLVSHQGTTTLGHTVPTCERFKRVEYEDQAADYVRDCRLALDKRGQA